MNKRILLPGIILSLSAFYIISCDDKKQTATKVDTTTVAAGAAVPAGQLNEPKAGAVFSVKDTASIKCYINTYAFPYQVKIFNEGYSVAEKELPAFITSKKKELQKYRVYLLTTQKNDYKKLIDMMDLLTINDIRDFEIVEDGKASR